MAIAETIEWIGLGVLFLSVTLLGAAWATTRRDGGLDATVAKLPAQSHPVFLVADEDLLDASPAGRKLLGQEDAVAQDATDLVAVKSALSRRFQDLDKLDPDEPKTVLPARDALDSFELLVERLDDVQRFEVRPVTLPGLATSKAPSAIHATEAKYATLRSMMDLAPYPIWRVNESGEVSWYNKAYDDLYRRTHRTRPQPGQRLFQSALDDKPSGSRIRASVSIPNQDSFFWYDVWITRHDGHKMFYAVDVGAVVNAEMAQRNFVQTLTKTFAQLSIGLAIFDRNRRLALFNPALIDLTALPADFLSARPNLLSFFDRLRDARMMPEPKDYANWRDQLGALMAAAADGNYQETWTLPSGSIYKVSGRPHPDGAVAFLFEDITAEVTLTRRFRSDLDMNQAILDRVDDAIAVFSASGVLTLSNRAYRELWQVDPDGAFADVSILDATRDWQNRCLPTPTWGQVRNFVAGAAERSTWRSSATLISGVELTCTVHPVQDGATLVSFRAAKLEDGARAMGHQLQSAD